MDVREGESRKRTYLTSSPIFNQNRENLEKSFRREARPENHNPWRKRGIVLATAHPLQESQHALRASGTCHPTPEIYSRQGLRALATLSLAYASGCDGGRFASTLLPPMRQASAGLGFIRNNPHILQTHFVADRSSPFFSRFESSL